MLQSNIPNDMHLAWKVTCRTCISYHDKVNNPQEEQRFEVKVSIRVSTEKVCVRLEVAGVGEQWGRKRRRAIQEGD